MLVVIEAVSVFVAASQPYVTVSWPTVAVVPASAANEKPFAPAPSPPTLPARVPVNVASRVPTSPAVLAELLPVRPSSSTDAADVLPSVGVFASVIVKLSVASTLSPSPSVTRTVKLTVGAVSFTRPSLATNVQLPSAFTVSVPRPVTVIGLPRSCSTPATTTLVTAPVASAPTVCVHVPSSVAPSATDSLSPMLTLGASSSNVMVSVLFVVVLLSASMMLYFRSSVVGFSVSSPGVTPSSVACSTFCSSVTL